MASRSQRLAQILEKEERGETNIRHLSSAIGEPPKAVMRLMLQQPGWKPTGRGVWVKQNADALGFALSFTCGVLLLAALLP